MRAGNEIELVNKEKSSVVSGHENTEETKAPNPITLIFKNKIKTPLKWVVEKDIVENDKLNIRAKCSYLYWACFRGRVDLVKHILEKDKISPFYRIYEGHSPLMACIIGKHAPMDVSSPHAVQ